MIEESDIWKCCTRGCKWQGTRSELDYQPDPMSKIVKIARTVGCCPKCGQHKKGFYVKKVAAINREEGE